MEFSSIKSYNHSGFTLLELLLVIAMIAVLGGLIIFSIRPAIILNDAKNVKIERVSDDMEKAIETYVINNSGSLPFTSSGLAQTAYSICKQGQSSGCDVNVDALVSNGYIQAVPENDGSSGNKSGYMLKYTSKGVFVGPSKINCPTGYIGVPGNPIYQTDDFCIMKYEAKNVSSIATSEAAGVPWTSINLTNATTACTALGSNYHLMSNNEWMTIARNVEQVASNWYGGVVGTNFMYSGHNDGGPNASSAADSDDSSGYYGTNDSASSCDGVYTNYVVGDDTTNGRACVGQRRTLTLSNGEVIWDLAGNVWERTSYVINCAISACTSAEMPYDSTPGSEWVEYTNLVSYGMLSYDLMRPSTSTWNSTQGLGKAFTDVNDGNNGGGVLVTSHSVLRGGIWSDGANAGIFTSHLNLGPGFQGSDGGFRCATTPV